MKVERMSMWWIGLTGCRWLYLVFFNMLWVFIPFWVLYEAYGNIKKAFVTAAAVREKKSE